MGLCQSVTASRSKRSDWAGKLFGAFFWVHFGALSGALLVALPDALSGAVLIAFSSHQIAKHKIGSQSLLS